MSWHVAQLCSNGLPDSNFLSQFSLSTPAIHLGRVSSLVHFRTCESSQNTLQPKLKRIHTPPFCMFRETPVYVDAQSRCNTNNGFFDLYVPMSGCKLPFTEYPCQRLCVEGLCDPSDLSEYPIRLLPRRGATPYVPGLGINCVFLFQLSLL